MQLLTNTKLSKWYFLYAILWMLIFMMFGIESGEGSQPTADSNPVLDTIFILSSPIVLPLIYYNLYRRVNMWLVFLTTPFLGIAMEWLLFKPADVLNESTPLEATFFFAWIWAVILIPPYFLTRFADKSKRNWIITTVFVVGFFLAQVVRLIV